MIAMQNKDFSITALDISDDMVSVAMEYIEKKGLQSPTDSSNRYEPPTCPTKSEFYYGKPRQQSTQ